MTSTGRAVPWSDRRRQRRHADLAASLFFSFATRVATPSGRFAYRASSYTVTASGKRPRTSSASPFACGPTEG